MAKKNMRQQVERAVTKIIRFVKQDENDQGVTPIIYKLWSELALDADVRKDLVINNLADRVESRLAWREPDFWLKYRKKALWALYPSPNQMTGQSGVSRRHAQKHA